MEKQKSTRKAKNAFKILFIVTLALLLVACGVMGYFLTRKSKENNTYATSLQNGYTRNFAELSSTMNEIDVNISKLIASSGLKARQKILLTIWRDCSCAQANLSNLPLEHESISNCLSFVNKLGEYCYFLNNKLITENKFESEVFITLNQLSEFSNSLSHDISLLSMNVSNGNFNILSDFNQPNMADFANFLDSIKTSTVETPSMIYDGPYSDAIDSKEIKGLENFETNVSDAQNYVAEIFKVNANDIKYLGETNSKFSTFNFEFMLNGKTAVAQITKQGKFLLQYNSEVTAGQQTVTKEEAIEIGKAFFDNLGIKNMQENWINVGDDEILINFAPVINDVVIYSDLIKIKVCKHTGMLSGFEAASYAYNHTERNLNSAQVSISEARGLVSDKLTINNERLCIIPKEFSDEVLAYEFACTYNDNTYYVYINAETGEEEEIFRVVNDENEGQLVL